MKEYVYNAMNERVLKELEPRPSELKLATTNNFGVNIENVLQGLGFIALEAIREGNMVVVSTPEKLLDRDWVIYFQDKEQDPLRLTICLNHGGEIGFMEFIKQLFDPERGYYIFIP